MPTLLDKFFSILFQMPDGRSLEQYYKSAALVAEIEDSELVDEAVFVTSSVLTAASIDAVAEVIKASSQAYLEAKAFFDQKGNSQTTSQAMYLLIFRKAEEDTYTQAMNKLKAINTKFAKVILTSSVAADIIDVAGWCLSNKRFLDCRVLDTTGLEELKTGLNNYVYALFRKSATATQGIASAVASTTTKGHFGGTDGSAQFTQLVGITPESYTDGEIQAMDAANIAYYSNVSPVDGGGAEDFGYNWVIGSKMIGGGIRQREMIKDYIEKGMALTILAFLNTKPGYDEGGNTQLYGMLFDAFTSYQAYNLVVGNTPEMAGFVLKVQRIRGTADSIQATDIEAYNKKAYKVSGYYYDKLVGEKIDINLVVDPTQRQVEELLSA